MNTYNYPTFGVIALVILVFVGVGALLYYAVDLTQNYYQVLDDLTALKDQVDALKKENDTLKTVNADLTNRNNGLEAEKVNLAATLQSCQTQNTVLGSSLVSRGTLQSSTVSSDPRALIILSILLIACSLAGTLSFKYLRGTHQKQAELSSRTSKPRIYHVTPISGSPNKDR